MNFLSKYLFLVGLMVLLTLQWATSSSASAFEIRFGNGQSHVAETAAETADETRDPTPTPTLDPGDGSDDGDDWGDGGDDDDADWDDDDDFDLPDDDGEEDCARLPGGCDGRIGDLVNGMHFGNPSVDGGVIFDSRGAGAAVRFRANVGQVRSWGGDIDVIPFELIFLTGQDRGNFRIRFKVADATVLFFCRGRGVDEDDDGPLVPPIASLLSSCREETGYFGIGGTIGEFQHDTGTGRWASRILALHAVVNFLGNGGTQEYLRRQLMAFAGASWDYIWNAQNTPGATESDQMMVRLNMGIMGMIRTDNDNFELRGYAGYRPNVADFTDFAVEARVEGLYNFLFNRNIGAQIGIETNFSYWSRPHRSIGPFASDRTNESAYIGALFRLIFD